jgi:hypothetical protein
MKALTVSLVGLFLLGFLALNSTRLVTDPNNLTPQATPTPTPCCTPPFRPGYRVDLLKK